MVTTNTTTTTTAAAAATAADGTKLAVALAIMLWLLLVLGGMSPHVHERSEAISGLVLLQVLCVVVKMRLLL